MVSIVVLSWNRKEDTLKTLRDLKCQTYKGYEVVLVDQASDDGTPEAVLKEFPEVNVIKLHRNFGVPSGRNIGIVNAKGEILVFIDNDASLACDVLEKVIERFSREDSLGIIGFKILNAFTKTLDLSSWVYQKNKIKESENEFYTYTFAGGSCAIRKELFNRIGFYWDILFFSWEEMDLSLRAINSDYNIIFAPNMIAYHRISQEKRKFQSFNECLRLRNNLWVLWRCMPIVYLTSESIIRICAYLIKGIRQRCFMRMLLYLCKSFSKIGLILNKEYKISRSALEKYRMLADKGPFFKQLIWLLFK